MTLLLLYISIQETDKFSIQCTNLLPNVLDHMDVQLLYLFFVFITRISVSLVVLGNVELIVGNGISSSY
jgi:hypothetical protein